jgi:hypothetical protein
LRRAQIEAMRSAEARIVERARRSDRGPKLEAASMSRMVQRVGCAVEA